MTIANLQADEDATLVIKGNFEVSLCPIDDRQAIKEGLHGITYIQSQQTIMLCKV